MTQCNGWTNRETWLVNIWYDPETVSDVQYAKEDLEAKVSELEGILQDMIDIGCIDWKELEDGMDEDEDEDLNG